MIMIMPSLIGEISVPELPHPRHHQAVLQALLNLRGHDLEL